MSLIEQRTRYMSKLQTLINDGQTKIEANVAKFRENLEIEQVQPYRAQLEKEKLTSEMSMLVTFIDNIDAMLEYEKSTAQVNVQVEQDVVQLEEQEKVEDIGQMFQEDDVEQEIEDDVEQEIEDDVCEIQPDAKHDVVNEPQHDDTANNTFVTAGFKTIVSDIADTREKLQSAAESRPGMPDIAFPRR